MKKNYKIIKKVRKVLPVKKIDSRIQNTLPNRFYKNKKCNKLFSNKKYSKISFKSIISKKKQFFEKKIVSKILYPKQFNRNTFEESSLRSRRKEGIINVYTVDNNTKLTTVPDLIQTQRRTWIRRRKKKKEKALRKVQRKSRVTQGRALILHSDIILKAKLNFDIYIKGFVSFHQKHNSTYLLKLQKMFNQQKLEKSRALLLLKPVKGGFKAYAGGVIGFLPRSHGIHYFKIWRSKLDLKKYTIEKHKSIIARNFILLKKKSGLNKIPLQTWHIVMSNLKIRVGYIKRDFVKTKKHFRKRRKKLKLSIVFITKKQNWNKDKVLKD